MFHQTKARIPKNELIKTPIYFGNDSLIDFFFTFILMFDNDEHIYEFS